MSLDLFGGAVPSDGLALFSALAPPELRAISPGTLARALFDTVRLPGEALAFIEPAAPGRFIVAIDRDRARTIPTPLQVLCRGPNGWSELTLGRETDPVTMPSTAWRLSWQDGGPTPPLGALAEALAALSEGALGAESLGLAMPCGGGMTLELPASAGTLPATTHLDVAGRAMTLSALPAADGQP